MHKIQTSLGFFDLRSISYVYPFSLWTRKPTQFFYKASTFFRFPRIRTNVFTKTIEEIVPYKTVICQQFSKILQTAAPHQNYTAAVCVWLLLIFIAESNHHVIFHQFPQHSTPFRPLPVLDSLILFSLWSFPTWKIESNFSPSLYNMKTSYLLGTNYKNFMTYIYCPKLSVLKNEESSKGHLQLDTD